MLLCYLAIKSNKVMTNPTTWLNLKNTMLSERSYTKDYIFCVSVYRQYLESAKIKRRHIDNCL